MKPLAVTWIILVLSLAEFLPAAAQESGSIPLTVTYVTSRQIYFDAGSEQGVTAGDTVGLFRSGRTVGKVVITAVASHSSVGRMIVLKPGIRAGDKGSILKGPRAGKTVPTAAGTAVRDTATPVSFSEGRGELREQENALTGRIGLQFTGEWADDSRLNVAQPAALAYLRLRNVLGTGMALSFSGREYYDMTGAYARYGDSVRSRFDLYRFQLERDRPGDWFGFSAGRMVSRYASGLGTFDGGHFFLRTGDFTAGALVGRGIQGRAAGIGEDETKTAVFVGFHNGDPVLQEYDASIAYARQTVHGCLDRSFVYAQGSALLGPGYFLFGNAEVDLNTVNNGRRASAARLTSAMLYFNFSPARWLSASLGYDGTRSIYLLETMKNFPDSLFNESIRHGLRARAALRPLPGVTLTGTASVGSRQGDPRISRLYSGDIRLLDLFGSGIHAGARYVDITNVYLDGTQFACELERFFFQKIDLLLRYDVYAYSVTGAGHAYRTQTISTNLSWYISRSLYSTVRGDYIIDDTMNSVRAFVEAGVLF